MAERRVASVGTVFPRFLISAQLDLGRDESGPDEFPSDLRPLHGLCRDRRRAHPPARRQDRRARPLARRRRRSL